MSVRVVVVGAGGHGREVLDVVDACNAVDTAFDVMGVVDDAPSEVNLLRLKKRGSRFLGSVEEWTGRGEHEVRYLVGIGSPAARRALDSRFSEAGFEPAVAVHPAAVLGSGVSLAPGVVVLAGSVLATNITVGRHTHVHRCATVGHDCVIGRYVTVNPSASISGDCVVEDGVLVGVGASVLQGLTVGHDSTVAGAACVVNDVPADTTVKGVPAR
jgi:sugar O-acyltransferase (sialic acid O-acetyltransferase NeuD family)